MSDGSESGECDYKQVSTDSNLADDGRLEGRGGDCDDNDIDTLNRIIAGKDVDIGYLNHGFNFGGVRGTFYGDLLGTDGELVTDGVPHDDVLLGFP